ncbi:MAG: hypothetical protein GTO14_19250 [Anaerolineales bacterium]|nr:hypothetical protein [Anaerolineales bacterium]
MKNLPEEKRIIDLIEEARSNSSGLDPSREEHIRTCLDRVQSLLSTPAKMRNHVMLLLSAALLQIKKTERLSIEAMLGGERITQNEMAALVRIRLICAEVINILSDATEERRLVPVLANR